MIIFYSRSKLKMLDFEKSKRSYTLGRREELHRWILQQSSEKNPWQRVRRWMRRGPHAEARISGRPLCCDGSVWWSFFGSESLSAVYLRFGGDSPMMEELEGPSGLRRVMPWRDTTLVTMVQESAACVDLLSHMVVDGGVWCGVRLFVLGFVVWWCCFGLLCTIALLLIWHSSAPAFIKKGCL
jgi:hypothetical protein